MKYKKLGLLILISAIVIFIFRNWFLGGELSSGDWVYYPLNAIKGTISIPVWDDRHNGMGATNIPTFGTEVYFLLSSKTAILFGWQLYERIFWFWPFLLVSFISSFLLFKKIFKGNSFKLLSSFIYCLNTYALMLIGGGQVGIALAYSVVPLVFISFINFLEKPSLKSSIILGFSSSLLIMFDPRVAYIVIIALIVYVAFLSKEIFKKDTLKKIILVSVSGIIIFLLHSYWFGPAVLTRQSVLNQFGAIYKSADAVKFFSFAKFENALGLLHPNWPENIFGKVGFMKPEFLLLPILAFSSLLFIGKKRTMEDLHVLLFAILGLVGIFLAKGANDPFGFIYLWMFDHVPGFIMFRDPTKWYILIVISYSVLIPFSLNKISIVLHDKVLRSKNKVLISINNILNTKYIILYTFIIYFVFLIRPAVFGELVGTFKPHVIPQEYMVFEKFISTQNNFSRTLWIPQVQRFGYFSSEHPAISAYDFYHKATISDILGKMFKRNEEQILKEASVKYVILPFDNQGEIFLKNRVYNEKIYKSTLESLRKIPYIKEKSAIGKIHIFEVKNPYDHIFLNDSIGKVSYTNKSTTEYDVKVKNVKRNQMVIFSENYDPFWILKTKDGKEVKSEKYNGIFNSFELPENGDYKFRIYYKAQNWVNIGISVTALAIIILLFIFVFLFKKNHPIKL